MTTRISKASDLLGAQLVDYTPILNIQNPIPTTISSLNLFEPTYHTVDNVIVTRDTTKDVLMTSHQRNGERNWITNDQWIQKPFIIPFFNVDHNVKPVDVQNFRAYATTAITERRVEQEVQRYVQKIRRSHSFTKEKILTEAVLGRSYAPGNLGAQVDYYTTWGVTQHVVNVDFAGNVDPSAVIEDQAIGYLIDEKKNGSSQTKSIAICSRTFWSKFINNAFLRQAYQLTVSGFNPNKERIDGINDSQQFEHKGVLYVLDIYKNIPEGEAYLFPEGIEGMFQTHFAPADTIEHANTLAEESYLFMLENPRTIELQSEFAQLAVNTRPELVVRLTSN